MKVTFDKALIQAEIARVSTSDRLMEKFGGPGLYLVGDQGIYLMGNDPSRDPARHPPVYAKECDPTVLPFDDWYSFKETYFGGDDGAEFMPLPDVMAWVANTAGSTCALDITPSHIMTLVDP